ncbi:hypothetical protein EDD85DRAFT_608752 [Armillaria nabsnona]|nr:hypothetical protein EDD85DRAFT_608752 [Armillaria nabsnona]
MRVQRGDEGGHTLESLITRWMTTFTVTRPSLFPLLVYILLPMAGHLPAFLPTHLDSLSFHLPKSIALRASFKFGSRHSLYKLRNLRTGVNIDEGSARVFGCGELSLGDGRPDGPQGKLSGQPVRSSSESNIDASSASALTSMDLISHTRSGDSNATLL